MICPECGNKEGNGVHFKPKTPHAMWKAILTLFFNKYSKWYLDDYCAYCGYEWNRFKKQQEES